jgi:ABC-type branched-subunit amino acid transport system ATPase component
MNIQLKDMVKRFGALEAVSHVSLDIRDGELCWGPQGAAKRLSSASLAVFTNLITEKSISERGRYRPFPLMSVTLAWSFRTTHSGPI